MTTARAITVMLLALSSMLLLAAACGDDGDNDTIVIAVQPTSTQDELSDSAGELEEFLEERVDADVEIRFPTSYGGVIESLRFGHADAAFMSAWPSQLATDDGEAEVVLAEVREVIIGDDAVEEPFYYSYWVVRPDSEYQSLEDLEGANAAFPSQLSTSGYVAPTARMKELGLLEPDDDGVVDPDDYFGDVFYAGGYSQAWEALQDGQVDVSVIAGDVPEELYREVLDNTRVIEEQGPVPSHAVVFSNDFEDPLRTELQEALMELGEEQHRELMRQFISGIFVRFEETTTEEHLGRLTDFLDETGLTFTERIQ